MQETYDVIVVGAGIVGAAVAYYTAKAGMRVALVDQGKVAGEASSAGAGMLAPLDTTASDHHIPLSLFCLAGLQFYDQLDQVLSSETGIDIEIMRVPTLRPAFSQESVEDEQTLLMRWQHLLPGLRWVEAHEARKMEPLLPETVLGALLSPTEYNVQVLPLTQAYARGALLHGAHLFEGRSVERFLQRGQRLVGVETTQGTMHAGDVVLAAGAWTSQWHVFAGPPPIIPVKGQMVELHAPPDGSLQHTIYAHGLGCLLPKRHHRIYVGATHESAGFDTTVTTEGVAAMRTVVEKLAPGLKHVHFERAWAGLRPVSVDGLPLIGPSNVLEGLWVASGHAQDGILLGPLTGHILAEWLQQHPIPCGLDLKAFHPDRFGGWGQRHAEK